MRSIYFSDSHLQPLRPWSWCTTESRDRFVRFLRWLAGQECEAVGLGDLFDVATWPVDAAPPTRAELLADPFLAPVLDAMGELANLVIVSGNHDLLESDLVKAVLPRARFEPEAYRTGDMWAAHGHAEALFCAPDPPWPVPLGYYVSRLAASAPGRPTRAQVVRELVQLGTARETLPEALLDAMVAHAGLSLDDRVVMPLDLGGGDISLAEVRRRYAGLVGRFEAQRGMLATACAIPAELGELELAAALVLETDDKARVVVLGHTHGPKVWRAGPCVYANCGAWCTPQAHGVDIVDGIVNLQEWTD